MNAAFSQFVLPVKKESIFYPCLPRVPSLTFLLHIAKIQSQTCYKDISMYRTVTCQHNKVVW
jgi:hypothetical protein